MELEFILLFLDTIFLQDDGGIFGFFEDTKNVFKQKVMNLRHV